MWSKRIMQANLSCKRLRSTKRGISHSPSRKELQMSVEEIASLETVLKAKPATSTKKKKEEANTERMYRTEVKPPLKSHVANQTDKKGPVPRSAGNVKKLRLAIHSQKASQIPTLKNPLSTVNHTKKSTPSNKPSSANKDASAGKYAKMAKIKSEKKSAPKSSYERPTQACILRHRLNVFISKEIVKEEVEKPAKHSIAGKIEAEEVVERRKHNSPVTEDIDHTQIETKCENAAETNLPARISFVQNAMSEKEPSITPIQIYRSVVGATIPLQEECLSKEGPQTKGNTSASNSPKKDCPVIIITQNNEESAADSPIRFSPKKQWPAPIMHEQVLETAQQQNARRNRPSTQVFDKSVKR